MPPPARTQRPVRGVHLLLAGNVDGCRYNSKGAMTRHPMVLSPSSSDCGVLSSVEDSPLQSRRQPSVGSRWRRRRGGRTWFGAACALWTTSTMADAFLTPSPGILGGPFVSPASKLRPSNDCGPPHLIFPSERQREGGQKGAIVREERFHRMSLRLRATRAEAGLEDSGIAHPSVAKSHNGEPEDKTKGAHIDDEGAFWGQQHSVQSHETAVGPTTVEGEIRAGPPVDTDANPENDNTTSAVDVPSDFTSTYSDDRDRRLEQLERLKEQLRQKRTNSGTNRERSASDSTGSSSDGLSKFHRSLLGPTISRQRFVTGRYPLRISVRDDPTRKFLGQTSTSQLLVNGTSVDRSLASYDRYQWLDEHEKVGGAFSLELIAEIHVRKPGYLNVLPGDGAGASAMVRRQLRENYGGWKNRWKLGTGPSMQSEAGEAPYGDRFWQEGDERPLERLWITGFSLTKQSGELGYVEVDSGKMGAVNKRTARAIRWPNEVSPVPARTDGRPHLSLQQRQGSDAIDVDISSRKSLEDEPDADALLVSDGFLVPGRDRGGLYVVRNPGDDSKEWRVCLTDEDDEGWFYHRAVWVDLTGDGRQSILTARARIPSVLKKGGKSTSGSGSQVSGGGSQKANGRTANKAVAEGQLVWLERPRPPKYDPLTGTPLDVDDTVFDPFDARNTPWQVRVLDRGPDVMFAVADLTPDDGTIEVIASRFFDRRVTLHSIEVGIEPRVAFRRVIDGGCGAAFSSVLADLDGPSSGEADRVGGPIVIDSGSTVPTLRRGDAFSHVLVTSHECTFAEKNQAASAAGAAARDEASPEEDFDIRIVNSESSDGRGTPSSSMAPNDSSKIDGGSLFAYRVPTGPLGTEWKTVPWRRTVMATGFRVRGQLGNMINPGAPGFCYTFYPTADGPTIPSRAAGGGKQKRWSRPLIGISGDCAEAAYILRPSDEGDDDLHECNNDTDDRSARYRLVCEIETGATVGSLGIGYDDFCGAEQQGGYAKIYVPCYERDRVLVFAMGTGDEELDNVEEL